MRDINAIHRRPSHERANCLSEIELEKTLRKAIVLAMQRQHGAITLQNYTDTHTHKKMRFSAQELHDNLRDSPEKLNRTREANNDPMQAQCRLSMGLTIRKQTKSKLVYERSITKRLQLLRSQRGGIAVDQFTIHRDHSDRIQLLLGCIQPVLSLRPLTPVSWPRGCKGY